MMTIAMQPPWFLCDMMVQPLLANKTHCLLTMCVVARCGWLRCCLVLAAFLPGGTVKIAHNIAELEKTTSSRGRGGGAVLVVA